jgi:hypothetical protein
VRKIPRYGFLGAGFAAFLAFLFAFLVAFFAFLAFFAATFFAGATFAALCFAGALDWDHAAGTVSVSAINAANTMVINFFILFLLLNLLATIGADSQPNGGMGEQAMISMPCQSE